MTFLDARDSISLTGPYYHERWTCFLIYRELEIKYYEKFIKSFTSVHAILNFATTKLLYNDGVISVAVANTCINLKI